MAKKKLESKPGYGKLLDAWAAPEDAGEPIGCLATSFTFSPVFFEEECLARFLQMESDIDEDGPAYIVEREEKLAQLSCAAALVDQHHCAGSRSLRWDLLSARVRPGLFHAKVSFLYWSRMIRIIIASANLTEDGYRRNQEVFGVLDFFDGGQSPLSCLGETVAFLRQAVALAGNFETPSPSQQRWNALLDRAARETATWGLSDEEILWSALRVKTLFIGPGYSTAFEALQALWPGTTPADTASVVSPFFDQSDSKNQPAEYIWKLVRQRGEATVQFHVTAEETSGEESLLIHAPKTLLDATPSGRPGATTQFCRITLPAGRSLHAKAIWLENDRWDLYLIGSGNFTSAGTGLSKGASNYEANLVYLADSHKDSQVRKLLGQAFPESELIELNDHIQWKPLPDDEGTLAAVVLLDTAFADAIYKVDDRARGVVEFSFQRDPPEGWAVSTEGDEAEFFAESEWLLSGKQPTCNVIWHRERPPSGFYVRWTDSGGAAWWPVNVTSSSVLPPVEELKNLPLEVLMNILSSSRPLHRVLADYLRRKQCGSSSRKDIEIIDPHKRVESGQFLLQRTRRVSWALNALRERLSRPAATLEGLRWRLHGPVGVMAFADALERGSRSAGETAFLISELALELARIKPESVPECIPAEQHMAEIRAVIAVLRLKIPAEVTELPDNLRDYVKSVFDAVTA